MNEITKDNFNSDAIYDMIDELKKTIDQVKEDITHFEQADRKWIGRQEWEVLFYANRLHKHYAEIFGLPADDFGFGEK